MNLELLDTIESASIKTEILQAIKYLPKAMNIQIDTVNKYEIDITCDPGFNNRLLDALTKRPNLPKISELSAGCIRITIRHRVTQSDRDERFDYILARILDTNKKNMTAILKKFSDPDNLGNNLAWCTEEAMEVAAVHNILVHVKQFIVSTEYSRQGLLDLMKDKVENYEHELSTLQSWAHNATSESVSMYAIAKVKAIQTYCSLYSDLLSTTTWGVDEA